VIVPNPRFRANPQRAVHVDGLIDDQQVSRLTPLILRLQQKSREPITVYILNSPGGPVTSMETILRLLKSPDQDFSPLCNVITVVTGRAGSAAADLLSSGDYAIAYPNSTILYHGIRTYRQTPLTMETTSLLTDWLRISNDYYAMELARKIENRFMFRFLVLKSTFQGFREKIAPRTMTDLECFIELLLSELSDKAKAVCNKAKDRYRRYQALLESVATNVKDDGANVAVIEGKHIKAIVDFEVAANEKQPDWTFKDGGFSRLADDFFLLNEYFESHETERIKQWCKSLGMFALTEAQKNEIATLQDDAARTEKMIEMVQPVLQPVWSFFVALCHALQEGENELTARDAYWLGLVDEVMGDSNLATLRLMMEYQSDAPAPRAEGADEEKNTEAGTTEAENAEGPQARPVEA
jgi:ATP-dependent protease ClpP protease subunit